MKTILDFLNTNSNAITALSAIIIASLAIYGIREWKRQIKGKTDYQIARRYLKESLKLRNEILYVRNPLIPLSEIETALKENGLEGEEYAGKVKTNTAVYSRRWKGVKQSWTNLEAEIIEAEISWGKEAEKVSRPLIALVRKLFAALQMYVDGYHQNIQDELIYNHGSLEEPDEFSKKIEKAIEDIKYFLKRYLL